MSRKQVYAQPKLGQKSFERAVFDGDIDGPMGRITTFGDGTYQPMIEEREVRLSETGAAIGYVLDMQDRLQVDCAETKPDGPVSTPSLLVSIIDSEFNIHGPNGAGMHRWGD